MGRGRGGGVLAHMSINFYKWRKKGAEIAMKDARDRKFTEEAQRKEQDR